MHCARPCGIWRARPIDTPVLQRLAYAALACLLIALTLGFAWLLGPGHLRIDTRLADLVPADVSGLNSRVADELVGDARDAASRVVSVHLEAERSSSVDAAAADVQRALRDIDGISVQDPDDLVQRLAVRLAPHRFSLLPSADRAALQSGDAEALVDSALSDLLAPGMTPRPLDIVDDPTNLMGRWMLQRASRVPAARSSLPSLRIDALLAAQVSNQDAVIEQWLDAFATLRSQHPDVTFLQTGVPLFAYDAAERSQTDINRITLGSLAGLALLLLPVFRSPVPLLIPAASIAVGAATGFVLVALLQPSVHVLTLVFGASLIGIAIDYSIHGYVHLHAGSTPVDSGGSLLRPLSLSLLTSVVGYGALAFSGIPAMASVALFSVGGLFGAWLTVVSLLPLSQRLTGGVHGGWVTRVTQALYSACHWLSARRLILVAVTVLASVVALFGTHVNDDPRRLIDLSPSLVADANAIGERWPGRTRSELVVATADNPQSLFDGLEAAGAALGADNALTSIVDWLPSPDEQASNRTLSQTLLTGEGVAARVLEAVGAAPVPSLLEALRTTRQQDVDAPLDMPGLFRDPDLPLPPLMAGDQSGYAAVAFPQGTQDLSVLDEPVDGTADIRVLNAVADAELALSAQRHATLRVLAVGVAGIALLMLMVYRSLRSLGLLCVPIGAVIGTLAVLALLGIPLTLFHAVGLFLVLGLGMDYAIFLGELDQESPDTTRLAVVLSAATSMISFGLLAVSSIPVARFFGQTVFIGNTLNLVLSFVMVALSQRAIATSVTSDPTRHAA